MKTEIKTSNDKPMGMIAKGKWAGITEFYCEYIQGPLSLQHNSCKANEAGNLCAISNEY